MVNILLIGDQQVGKTSWLNRISGKKFHESYMTTIGKDMKEIAINDRKIFVHDIGGSERYHQSINMYYDIADGALIFYDVADRDSFNRINYWRDKLRKDTPIVLIGNKADLLDNRLDNFISCKEDVNVSYPLIELLDKIPIIEHIEDTTILNWMWGIVYYYFGLYAV